MGSVKRPSCQVLECFDSAWYDLHLGEARVWISYRASICIVLKLRASSSALERIAAETAVFVILAVGVGEKRVLRGHLKVLVTEQFFGSRVRRLAEIALLQQACELVLRIVRRALVVALVELDAHGALLQALAD